MYGKRYLQKVKSNAGIMKILKLFLLLFVFLTISQNSFAKRAPTLANSYNGIPPNARSMGMGGAGTGLPSKESFYYNSAALSSSSGAHFDASVMISRESHALPNEVAIMDPAGQGLMSAYVIKDTGALIWQALSDSTYMKYYPNGDWQQSETYINSITFAAGQKNDKNYSIGLNLSYLYGKIGESSVISGISDANIASGNGLALDLSFLFPVTYSMHFGINLKNIAGFMFWDDYDMEQLPFIIRTGVGYSYKGISFALDYDKKFYRIGKLTEEHIYLGIEQYLSGFMCIRAGAVTTEDFNQKDMKYTYGMGFKLKTYEFAFAGESYKINNEAFLKHMISFSASVY